ncbi:MAG: carboxypeptidase-like regulatory domain-containing protein, partial [Bacteroidota bacterium]
MTDSLGEPLPYVSVLIAGTSIGTTTNLNGDYSLQVAQGLRMITFSMIGYAQRTETIEVGDSDIRFDVHLIPATYRLSEVVVSTCEEDPANAII